MSNEKDIINQIINAEELYIVYNQGAGYLYIDSDNRSLIFTSKENAEHAVEEFKSRNIDIRIGEIDSKNKSIVLSELHRLGIDKVLVDQGTLDMTLNRDDIIPPEDFGDMPENDIPVTNPKIQNAIIKFYQKINDKDKKDDEEIMKLQENMFSEIADGRFIIPIKFKEGIVDSIEKNNIIVENQGTKVIIASVSNREGEKWLPAFTDWFEFRKIFDVNEWSGNIVSYDDLVIISDTNSGIVINCAGLSMNLKNTDKRVIVKYKKKC